MAAAKLFLLSCLVAVVWYFTYRELQVNTLGLVKKIHIPAKRSDKFQKLFDDPEFYLKINPLWYVFLSTLFHNREVSFDIFRVIVPSGFQKPRCRCEFDGRIKLLYSTLYCSTGVSNIVKIKENEGRRVVQFDIQENNNNNFNSNILVRFFRNYLQTIYNL